MGPTLGRTVNKDREGWSHGTCILRLCFTGKWLRSDFQDLPPLAPGAFQVFIPLLFRMISRSDQFDLLQTLLHTSLYYLTPPPIPLWDFPHLYVQPRLHCMVWHVSLFHTIPAHRNVPLPPRITLIFHASHRHIITWYLTCLVRISSYHIVSLQQDMKC